jgi:hypothetical protein
MDMITDKTIVSKSPSRTSNASHKSLKMFATGMHYPSRERHGRNKTTERKKIIYLKPYFAHKSKAVSDLMA